MAGWIDINVRTGTVYNQTENFISVRVMRDKGTLAGTISSYTDMRIFISTRNSKLTNKEENEEDMKKYRLINEPKPFLPNLKCAVALLLYSLAFSSSFPHFTLIPSV